MQKYKKFSDQFNKYRLKAQFETLTQFGEALAKEGFAFEDSLFSRWKNSSRMPRNRSIILAILKVFIKHKSLITPIEANEFLRIVNQPNLSPSEQLNLFNTYSFTQHTDYTTITEHDAFFLAQKILGLPFTTIHTTLLQKLYTLTKQTPHKYIQALQEIEHSPASLQSIISKLQNHNLLIHDHSSFSSNTTFTYLKKLFSVSFSDKHIYSI